jgi:hypothetical protein
MIRRGKRGSEIEVALQSLIREPFLFSVRFVAWSLFMTYALKYEKASTLITRTDKMTADGYSKVKNKLFKFDIPEGFSCLLISSSMSIPTTGLLRTPLRITTHPVLPV